MFCCMPDIDKHLVSQLSITALCLENTIIQFFIEIIGIL